jgi:hypothetical protein
MEQKHCKRWTKDEDNTILRHVKARPQNLKFCFLMVSEQIGRTPGAVANRWYSVVSKDPRNMCFFTASPSHVSRNRKNGEGEESNPGIWRRLITVLRSLGR